MKKKMLCLLFAVFILAGNIFIYSQTDMSFKPDMVVAKDNSGNFNTVQQAINAVPDGNNKWIIIYIKNGIYKEKLKIDAVKSFIHIIGENNKDTVLTYDDCNSSAKGTAASASVTNYSADFIAENITFENSFDYDNSKEPNKQAVALLANADRQIYYNCRFLGHQDTLFMRAGRQYFKNCYIAGHSDFIFGDSTAVFENCEIHSLYKEGASISAPSTLAETNFGLIFMNCNFTADQKFKDSSNVFLGRPWHPSSVKVPVKSNSVYINCNLGTHIHPDGWTDMSGVYPKTERLWEYKNTGAGAKKNKSRKQLSAMEAKKYTVVNIFSSFKGITDNWDPSKLIK